jgi:thioredoxin reductase/bacterioferritin-associated ferredoxin
MKNHYDIAVIGAGPAGMAAAVLAAKHSASVLLLDEQMHAGGQIYRNVSEQVICDKDILGPDYYAGSKMVEKFAASSVEYVSGVTVWQVSREREIGISKDGSARIITADQIIIATGAQERPFPIPGWTLPGVMNAGAAQILLKSAGIAIPDAVFIGTGPLLYLIAYQYLQAGIPIKAIVDTTPRINYFHALPHLPAALSNYGGLLKGRRWLKQLHAADIAFFKGACDISLAGDSVVKSVEFRHKGKRQRLDTENVFLHQGVVPNNNLTVATGCKHNWNDAQLCWHAVTDKWLESDIAGIAIAGDGAGIDGASAAEISGQIAALGAVYRCGKIDENTRNQSARPLIKALQKERKSRPFLDALFRPGDVFRIPESDTTVVCRCEEVTAGEIRKAVLEGCLGPNQLKSFTRCGMGPCQGRMCGLTVSEIIAKSRNVSVTDVGAYRLRAPVKPLMLGELANLDADITRAPAGR